MWQKDLVNCTALGGTVWYPILPYPHAILVPLEFIRMSPIGPLRELYTESDYVTIQSWINQHFNGAHQHAIRLFLAYKMNCFTPPMPRNETSIQFPIQDLFGQKYAVIPTSNRNYLEINQRAMDFLRELRLAHAEIRDFWRDLNPDELIRKAFIPELYLDTQRIISVGKGLWGHSQLVFFCQSNHHSQGLTGNDLLIYSCPIPYVKGAQSVETIFAKHRQEHGLEILGAVVVPMSIAYHSRGNIFRSALIDYGQKIYCDMQKDLLAKFDESFKKVFVKYRIHVMPLHENYDIRTGKLTESMITTIVMTISQYNKKCMDAYQHKFKHNEHEYPIFRRQEGASNERYVATLTLQSKLWVQAMSSNLFPAFITPNGNFQGQPIHAHHIIQLGFAQNRDKLASLGFSAQMQRIIKNEMSKTDSNNMSDRATSINFSGSSSGSISIGGSSNSGNTIHNFTPNYNPVIISSAEQRKSQGNEALLTGIAAGLGAIRASGIGNMEVKADKSDSVTNAIYTEFRRQSSGNTTESSKQVTRAGECLPVDRSIIKKGMEAAAQMLTPGDRLIANMEQCNISPRSCSDMESNGSESEYSQVGDTYSDTDDQPSASSFGKY